MELSAAERTLICHVDSKHVEPLVWEEGYGRLFVLAFAGYRPHGTFMLERDTADVAQTLSAGDIAALVHARLGPPPEPEDPVSTDLPPISVVVCTRDRPHMLARCLAALARQDHHDVETIVVDNGSRNAETRQQADLAGARYLREERPGLDWARNCGARAARHAIIAYTDDDAVPARHWLTGVARGFVSADIWAVTGPVLPHALETRAQQLFEHYGGGDGMSKGLRRRQFDPREMSDHALIWAPALGVGANMAIRRSALHRIGGFDTALDTGTPARGGGDYDALQRILLAGGSIAYEPAALVSHEHRRTMTELRHQLFGYGCSFGVFVIICLRRKGISRRSLAGFVMRVWMRSLAGRLALSLIGRDALPWRLRLAELCGACSAPWAYFATQRSDRILRRKLKRGQVI